MDSVKADSAPAPVCHIVTPIGMLGYGFDEQEIHAALGNVAESAAPAAIILDSGSTDSGPRKLAKGDMTCPRTSYVRDLRKLLRCVRKFGVPLLVSSAGGDGANAHVKVLEEIVQELAAESSESVKVVSIPAGINKDLVRQRLRSGDISSCGASVPALQERDVDEATQIVAQMGPEPYLAAMDAHPDFDVVLGGRSNDPAPYVAFATAAFRKSVPDYEVDKPFAEAVAGGLQHMGKIMECGGLCAKPKSAGAVATVYSDGSFEIAPTNAASRCTPVSVAAHTLYENSRPDILASPGGWLDLNASAYEQLADGRTVRVRGGVYKRSVDHGRPYQIKLEAARNKGFRYMYMGAMRDPILISQLDNLLARIKKYVQMQLEELIDGAWDLDFHVYGRDTAEVFLVAEALAETPEIARSIAATARTATIHGHYPGQKATGGNFAFGLGGIPEIDCGSLCEFCIYHLMDLRPGEEISLFPFTAQTFPGCLQLGDELACSTSASKSESKLARKAVGTSSDSGAPAEVQLKDAKLLSDVAKVLRSKNAGPYEITLDVMFDRREVFEAMQNSNLLTADTIAELYKLNADEIIWCGWYRQALAFKATIPRRRGKLAMSNGGFMESDMHGAQQYMPLFNLSLPTALRDQLAGLDIC